jgi:hypothetical protein
LPEVAVGSPAAAAAAAAAAAGLLPMKPCHRSVHNGVIQVRVPTFNAPEQPVVCPNSAQCTRCSNQHGV